MKDCLTEDRAREMLRRTRENADSDNADQVDLIYNAVRQAAPLISIELGVRRGVSTRAILAAVAKQTNGVLYSVDNDTRWMSTAREIFESFPEVEFRWSLTIDDSVSFAHRWKLGLVDFMFIDTSHEYEQTKAELEVYMPMLAKGGVALFHDTRNQYADGVLKPILEYMGDHLDYEYKELGGEQGLGRLRRV